MREEAQIRARNRIRELIGIDLERRKIKEDKKIGKNEIILEEPKFEDKKEEKIFEGFSKEDYFKGFDAFKENLSAEFKKIFKSKDCFEFSGSRFEFSEVVNSNRMKIEDKKEDTKIDQREITFGNKSLAESIYNDKSSKKSEKLDGDYSSSDDEDSVSKLILGSDF